MATRPSTDISSTVCASSDDRRRQLTDALKEYANNNVPGTPQDKSYVCHNSLCSANLCDNFREVKADKARHQQRHGLPGRPPLVHLADKAPMALAGPVSCSKCSDKFAHPPPQLLLVQGNSTSLGQKKTFLGVVFTAHFTSGSMLCPCHIDADDKRVKFRKNLLRNARLTGSTSPGAHPCGQFRWPRCGRTTRSAAGY